MEEAKAKTPIISYGFYEIDITSANVIIRLKDNKDGVIILPFPPGFTMIENYETTGSLEDTFGEAGITGNLEDTTPENGFSAEDFLNARQFRLKVERSFIVIVFENNGEKYKQYYYLSRNEKSPGVICGLVTNMNQIICYMEDFPRPFWQREKTEPLNKESYPRFLEQMKQFKEGELFELVLNMIKINKEIMDSPKHRQLFYIMIQLMQLMHYDIGTHIWTYIKNNINMTNPYRFMLYSKKEIIESTRMAQQIAICSDEEIDKEIQYIQANGPNIINRLKNP